MTQSECLNCGSPYGPNDVFCENCGYDTLTGSLPPEESSTDVAEAPSVLQEVDDADAAVPVVKLTVGTDNDYFEEVVQEGEMDFPTDAEPDQTIEVSGSEIHIGRTSESRSVHPDIDIEALTGDQAVSGRHAILRVSADGSCTISDIGSTNGTFVGDITSEALPEGDQVKLEVGVDVYLGAWTRLRVDEVVLPS